MSSSTAAEAHLTGNPATTTTTSAGDVTSAGTGTAGMNGGRASRLDLAGVFPPIATPFNDNENVNYDKLDFNLRRWNDVPFKGYI